MDLFLARHGDTFEKSDKVVWVGSRNDLPLTKNGFLQARSAANYFKQQKIIPAQIFCGPLKRAKDFASTISDELGARIPLTIESALNEIDYGDWSGLTSEEIIDRFGKDKLDGWEKLGIWPKDSGWKGSEPDTLSETKNWAEQLVRTSESPILAVTSNGRLRYFWKLCEKHAP